MTSMTTPDFPIDFLSHYLTLPAPLGKKRVFTYTVYRFLSFAGKQKPDTAAILKKNLFPDTSDFSFSVISDYLNADCYFSPAFEDDSFDAFFLYSAIRIADGLCEGNDVLGHPLIDELILTLCPVPASVSLCGESPDLTNLIQNEGDFYACLYLALTKYNDTFSTVLPKLADCYQEKYRFSTEDFILYEFMDEYFERSSLRLTPAFAEMTDALVQATLSYYKTDIGTLLETEINNMLGSSSSRFSAIKQFGAVRMAGPSDRKSAEDMLLSLFRYAALYELRSHLFDYHLEDDALITLDNWKEKLHWHYIQYANVYTSALDAFYAATLSRRLLKLQFLANLAKLA